MSVRRARIPLILPALLGLLALLYLPLPLAAASAAPSAAPAAIELGPVTDEGYHITSVAPVGWGLVGPGIRARQASAEDPTLLALQSAPVSIDDLWPSLLPQLGLTQAPEPVDARTTDAGLAWQLYRVPVRGAIADLALAAGSGTTYLVLLVSSPAEHDQLTEAVFLPAVDALAPLVEERTPLPSGIGYHELDVTFPGGATDVTLAGTLTVPDGQAPHPAVVLMSGSGPQDRDESLPGLSLKPFALLADALGRAGVAVLRYDDRGTARSTGGYDTATLADFTADGAAALAYLRTRSEIDPARVGILGHSEGGAYIASIAAGDPDVAFVVGLAPMVRAGVDLLVDQNGAIARSQGMSDADVASAEDYARELYAAILSDDRARIEGVMRAYLGAEYDRLPPDQQAMLGDRDTYIEAQVDAQVPVVTSPWFVSFLRADPSADWSRVAAPVLGVFGGKDVQVPAVAEAAALGDALTAAGNHDFTIVTVPDANHLFQHATTGALDEYARLDQMFTPDLLPLVTDWIRGVTGLAEEGSPEPS